jgi:hypothetical protein
MPSKNQTVTSKSDPWEDAQPYILAALVSYQELFESDPDGALIVEERDAYTIQAEDTVITRVASGAAIKVSQAAQTALNTIVAAAAPDYSAKYTALKAPADYSARIIALQTASDAGISPDLADLSGFSDLSTIFSSVQSLVTASVTAQFAGANRIGGALYPVELARGLTEAYSPFELQARQMGMSGATSKIQAKIANSAAISSAIRTGLEADMRKTSDLLAASQFELQHLTASRQLDLTTKLNVAAVSDKVDQGAMMDVKLLAGVGSDRESYAKRLLDAPYVQKSRWLDVVGTAGGFGGTSQQTQSGRGGGVTSALGGALSGAASGFAMGGPFGALIGGGLGLLGGLF